jgi:hypothetical protein
MARHPGIRAAALAAGLAALVAGAASAELAKWDQARATSLAGELATATDGLEKAVRELPAATAAGGSPEASERLRDSSRRMKEESKALSGHLSAGKGQEETKNLYKGLKEASDDAAEAARSTMLPEPVMDAWTKVSDLLGQLAPYYDPKALAP